MNARYCHISAQSSRYAGELGKLDAYDEARAREIQRIVDGYPDARAMAEQIIGEMELPESDDAETTHMVQRIIERIYERAAGAAIDARMKRRPHDE